MTCRPDRRVWWCGVLALLVGVTVLGAPFAIGLAQAPPTSPPTSSPRPTQAPPTPTPTPVIPIPPPVAPLDTDPAVDNIVLLGADTTMTGEHARTDVVIVVSINRRAGSVAMWHVPRDLFIYIPGHTMDRVNLVYQYGARDGGPEAAFKLLQETFMYNFGLQIDHYALVNFSDFQTIIARLGGLTISVDCALQDWRLIDPSLDPALEESWELYTLPIGRRTLSPEMALWYVRSRQSTSDFDRGRRQMDVLRAIWQQAREHGLLEQVTDLGPELLALVETDMTLGDLLGYVPLAIALEPSQIARYTGSPGVEYQGFLTPDDGRAVQLPVRAALLPLLRDFLTPPTENRLRRAAVSVEIADASYLYAGLAEVAADRLAWAGYAARVVDDGPTVRREASVIYDYTGLSKGSALPELLHLLRIDETQVIHQPDPNRTVDFHVEIGARYNACVLPDTVQEAGAATPAPSATPASCWLRFTAEVNMRLGPGTDWPAIDTTTPGLSLPALGRTADGSWWQAQLNGQPGWFSGTITTVEVAGACDDVPVIEP